MIVVGVDLLNELRANEAIRLGDLDLERVTRQMELDGEIAQLRDDRGEIFEARDRQRMARGKLPFPQVLLDVQGEAEETEGVRDGGQTATRSSP